MLMHCVAFRPRARPIMRTVLVLYIIFPAPAMAFVSGRAVGSYISWSSFLLFYLVRLSGREWPALHFVFLWAAFLLCVRIFSPRHVSLFACSSVPEPSCFSIRVVLRLRHGYIHFLTFPCSTEGGKVVFLPGAFSHEKPRHDERNDRTDVLRLGPETEFFQMLPISEICDVCHKSACTTTRLFGSSGPLG